MRGNGSAYIIRHGPSRCGVRPEGEKARSAFVNRGSDAYCTGFFVSENHRGNRKCLTITQKKSELLNEFEAAEFLQISVSWLRQSRLRKAAWPGPIFVKHDGWHIRYRKTDLIAFRKNRGRPARVVNSADRIKTAQRKKAGTDALGNGNPRLPPTGSLGVD